MEEVLIAIPQLPLTSISSSPQLYSLESNTPRRPSSIHSTPILTPVDRQLFRQIYQQYVEQLTQDLLVL